MTETPDPRAFSPATARNRQPIIDVLRHVLPPAGLALEIASGSGEHAAAFAEAFPDLTWQPTDGDPRALASIGAHAQAADLTNIRAPVVLDAAAPAWPVSRADAIVCINMVHISPWAACEGLMAGAGRVLPADGVLYLYGPFKEGGIHTADSNRAFDEDLRRRNPRWGVRDLEEVVALADHHGLAHVETVVMPANNRSVVFRKTDA